MKRLRLLLLSVVVITLRADDRLAREIPGEQKLDPRIARELGLPVR